MGEPLRKSGIEIIGDVPWGTHFCQFYESGDDLLDILVPYFKAGLQNNEFCMWVTAEPVGVADAKRAIGDAIPDLQQYLDSGQLEIIPYGDWYVKDGAFESQRVLDGWVEKLNGARVRGFDGLRLTGNTFWLEKRDWQDFADYERAVDSVIGRYHMVALCTYPVARCGVAEVADVISNHQFALIKRHNKWEAIESAKRIRAEVALRDSEERATTILESITDAFFALDHEWRFTYVNKQAEPLLHRKREDLIGKGVWDEFPEAVGSTFYQQYHKAVAEQVSVTVEEFYPPLDTWFYVRAYPSSDGLAVYFENINQRKQTEAERELLLREVQRRANELNAANEELEAFSYSVSHDLRAPLRSIDGFSQAVLEDYSEKIDEQGKTYLRLVRQECQRMAQLIDDLLHMSRITRWELRREPVDLSRLAWLAVDELRRTNLERQVEFLIAPSVMANGDARLLSVVLKNLLGNAWKFTSKHATAKIEFGVVEQNGEKVYFVRDDGAGFDMAYASKMFGAFQRLHSDKEFLGNGIGLANVLRVIRRHGGRVWAEGKVEQGATFSFTL